MEVAVVIVVKMTEVGHATY